MSNCLLEILLLHAQIAIKALNVGHFELLLARLHGVVLHDHLLIFGTDRLLIIVLSQGDVIVVGVVLISIIVFIVALVVFVAFVTAGNQW